MILATRIPALTQQIQRAMQRAQTAQDGESVSRTPATIDQRRQEALPRAA